MSEEGKDWCYSIILCKVTASNSPIIVGDDVFVSENDHSGRRQAQIVLDVVFALKIKNVNNVIIRFFVECSLKKLPLVKITRR